MSFLRLSYCSIISACKALALWSLLGLLLNTILATSASSEETSFYYKWDTRSFTGLQDACLAGIAAMNAGSGHNFAFDSIANDTCPATASWVSCASCIATQNKYPFHYKQTIGSVYKRYVLNPEYDNNLANECVGNPVDPVSGNKFQIERLVYLESSNPIKLDLFYNSNRLEKWRHSYSKTFAFSASPAGNRYDFNGLAFELNPYVQLESDSSLGVSGIQVYGAASPFVDLDQVATFPSEEKACVSGWAQRKDDYQYSWIAGSAAEYAGNGRCIIRSADGVSKMTMSVYEVISGRPVGYSSGASSYIRFTREDGRVVTFALDALENMSNTGERLEFTSEAGMTTYFLHTVNDEIEEYDISGKLISITSPQGHAQILSYDTESGILERVENDTGEYITFNYQDYGTVEGDGNPYKRIRSIEDHAGREWIFNYDPDTYNLTSIINPDTTVRTYHYEDPVDPRLLTGITDESGQRYSTWAYNEDGKATLSVHGADLIKDRVEIDYQANGNRAVDIVRKSGLLPDMSETISSTFKTHVGGNKPLVAEVTGHDAVKYEHDADSGYLLRSEDNGLVTEYADHDNAGNPGAIKEAVDTDKERATTYTYDSRFVSKVATITEKSVSNIQDEGELNKVTTYTYDDHANVISLTIEGHKPNASPVSRMTTFKYEGPYRQLTEIDGPRTDVSDVYVIDYYPDSVSEGSNRARMRRVSAPMGIVLYEDIAYSATGKITGYTDSNGVQLAMTYYPENDRLHTLTQTDPVSGNHRLTEFSYRATGEVETITNGVDVLDKTTLTLQYDDARRLERITDGLGNYIEYILDSEGNVEQENIRDSSDNLYKQLTQTFDAYNRLDLRTQANEQYTEAWSPDGTLDYTVDGKNAKTDYGYDVLRRLTSITMDEGGSSPQTADALTTLDYDVQDNLTRVTNPVSGDASYEYDDLGNLLRRVSSDTGVTDFTHDDAGNILSTFDANGETISYAYDALNRLTTITASNPDDSYQFEYDNCQNGAGRLCKVTGTNSTQFYSYDAFGNVQGQQALAYSYDTANRLKTITYPSSAELTYGYDAAGNIQSVMLDRNGSIVPLATNISYQPFRDVKNLHYGNGLTLTQGRDQAYRPIIQQVLGTFLLDYTRYDENGNLIERQDSIAGKTTSYGYDAHHRLSFASGDFGSGGTDTRAYEYDKNANRILLTEDGVSTVSSYESGSNRLSMRGLDNVTLDGNGNATDIGNRGYGYTKHNRLFQVYDNGVHKATYRYNGLGQRTSKTIHSGIEAGKGKHFLYGADGTRDGMLMAELDINGNILKEYFYLNGQLLAIYSPDSDNDGISNEQEDRAGTNPVALDSDDDGISDIDEIYVQGTNHLSVDTDGDGIEDGYELALNSDPRDSGINIGDINLNGEFNLGDYVLLVQYVMGTRTPSPTEQEQADINRDGAVNVQDMLIMQRILLGYQVSWSDISVPGLLQGILANLYDTIVPQAFASIGDGDIYYVHNDHLGTPQKMTDEDGFVVWQVAYDPFGKATVNEDVDRNGVFIVLNIRFPGQYYDAESGLHYNYFRTYDPELGRYLTSDPIGLLGGVNTFGYVGGNPVGDVDIYGLVSELQVDVTTETIDQVNDKVLTPQEKQALCIATNCKNAGPYMSVCIMKHKCADGMAEDLVEGAKKRYKPNQSKPDKQKNINNEKPQWLKDILNKETERRKLEGRGSNRC